MLPTVHQFKVYEPSTHKEINKLFTEVGLNKTLKANDTITKFSQRPELAEYLSHCARVSEEVWQPRLYYLLAAKAERSRF